MPGKGLQQPRLVWGGGGRTWRMTFQSQRGRWIIPAENGLQIYETCRLPVSGAYTLMRRTSDLKTSASVQGTPGPCPAFSEWKGIAVGRVDLSCVQWSPFRFRQHVHPRRVSPVQQVFFVSLIACHYHTLIKAVYSFFGMLSHVSSSQLN